MKNPTVFLQSVIALFCCLLTSTVFASGFRLPEISIAGTGLSNAMVANPDLPGALPYNPAAMAFHKQGQFVAGATIIRPDISVSPELGTAADSQGKDSILVPTLFATRHINSDWSWGVGVNSPFGLETKWEAGTFGTFALGGASVAALEPEHSKIKMLNLNPNVAYQLNANTSLAFGIDNYRVLDLIFNTQAIKISGDGDDYGWNIGVLHKQDNWSVGLSYRSSVKVDLEGSVAAGPFTSPGKASVKFPSLLQIGGRYKIDDKLAVELDLEKTGWSSFDMIEIEHSNPAVSANPITSTNDWKNAMAYRLGGTYELSPANQLRLGYSLDNSPGNDDFFSARVPGNDRQTLSFGLAHKRASWTIELAYMYVKADDRKINSSTSFLGGLPGNTDPNGTDAFNGTYKLKAHLFGLGVNTEF
jgi:long-chain fatty acid transport protein